MPVRFAVVHRSGALRLTNGFRCALAGEMAHRHHSTGRTADGAGSTKVKRILGGERGLDRPFKGNLGRLFFCGGAPCALHADVTFSPDLPCNERIAWESTGRAAPEPRRSEPVFNLPPVVLALIGICVAVHIVSAFLLTDDQFLLSADQCGLHPDPLQRPVRPRHQRLHLAADLCLPAWLDRASGDQHDLAGGVRLAARQPHGGGEIPVVLGIHLAGRGRLALRAAHARPGAADRRFGRHLGDDGGGGAIRLPHRPQPRPRGFCRRAAADRRMPALAQPSSPSWRSGWSSIW